MPRFLIADIQTALAEVNLQLVTHKKQKGLNKYVATDAGYNPLFGGDTLADVAEGLAAYKLTLATEPETKEIEILQVDPATFSFEGVDTTDFIWKSGLPLSEAVYPLTCSIFNHQTCDILEGAHNGSCCELPEPEADYWTTWHAAFEYAKRQLIGATAAAAHIVVERPRKLTLAEIMDKPMPAPDPELDKELAILEELFYPTQPKTDYDEFRDLLPSSDEPIELACNLFPQSDPAPKEEFVSPMMIGVYFLAAFALILEGAVWLITQVIEERLIQRGYDFVKTRYDRHVRRLSQPTRSNLSIASIV